MRVVQGPANERFIAWLQSISYDRSLRGRIEIPSAVTRFYEDHLFREHVYPPDQMATAVTNPDFFRRRAILAMRNDTVGAINDAVLRLLPGPSRDYLCADHAEQNPEDTTDLLNSLNCPSIPPARLRLKVGAPVMLLRNLLPEEGLCNGTRLVIKTLLPHCVWAEILTGSYAGQTHIIPRITLESNKGDLPVIISRNQLPLRLCFAITVNKSQGQSLDTVGLDLRIPAFAHGQLYVALSRVTDLRGLSVLLTSTDDAKTENIVYPEVLLRRPADGRS